MDPHNDKLSVVFSDDDEFDIRDEYNELHNRVKILDLVNLKFAKRIKFSKKKIFIFKLKLNF